MSSSKQYIVAANGAAVPNGVDNILRFDYRSGYEGQLINLGLSKFVEHTYHISPRILDLIEIAGYIYAADRYIRRGSKTALEYHSWSRSITFYIKVRDIDFWDKEDVKQALKKSLMFMTGDSDLNFHFEEGHNTPATNLFDRSDFELPEIESGVEITLFSGGLDSLSGAIDLLENCSNKIILVSHQSYSGTYHTQRKLVNSLKLKYPNRIYHYRFECTLRKYRAKEETQRTRSFLFTSIANAIASVYRKNHFYVYENGITSLNLQRRGDLANARTSRTTHPQTIENLSKLFTLINNQRCTISLPYLFLTKCDVINRIKSKYPELISSTVSCTKRFNTEGISTHCGGCFQCIDRRISSYACNAEDYDHHGLYTKDIIVNSIDDNEARTIVVDYIRQAIEFANSTIDNFEAKYIMDLIEIIDYIPNNQLDSEKTEKLFQLFRKYGQSIYLALTRMREKNEDIFRPVHVNSLLGLVSNREYLKPEITRAVNSIIRIINPALGEMFTTNQPKNEPDLNTKLGALLRTHEPDIRSEHPTVSFACAKVVPDHTLEKYDVLIEAKYIRNQTTPSKVTDGIASDITKYAHSNHIVFVVYDPGHNIQSDRLFVNDIESKGNNTVLIVR